MKVTEIGTKVKQKIRLVADHLKSNLTCPKYKFVLEMLAGIININRRLKFRENKC